MSGWRLRLREYSLLSAGGVASSAAALLIAWAIAVHGPGIDLMGWYLWPIPVGAIAIGVVAASGYLVTALLTGAIVPLRWGWLAILLAQFAAYVGSEYVQHRNSGPTSSFAESFDARSQSYRFVNTGAEEPVQGYFLRSLEMLGFALPGLLVPLVLSKVPRCRSCGRYERSKSLPSLKMIPQEEFSQWRTLRSFQPGDSEGWDTKEGYFRDEVIDTLRPLIEEIEGGEPRAIRAAMRAMQSASREITSPHCIIKLQLHYCRRCMEGRLLTLFRYQKDGSSEMGLLPGIAVDDVAISALLDHD